MVACVGTTPSTCTAGAAIKLHAPKRNKNVFFMNVPYGACLIATQEYVSALPFAQISRMSPVPLALLTNHSVPRRDAVHAGADPAGCICTPFANVFVPAMVNVSAVCVIAMFAPATNFGGAE